VTGLPEAIGRANDVGACMSDGDNPESKMAELLARAKRHLEGMEAAGITFTASAGAEDGRSIGFYGDFPVEATSERPCKCPICWQSEADRLTALLAERDAEIERLTQALATSERERVAMAEAWERQRPTPPTERRCHCGRDVTVGPDPWCMGCVQSAVTCDCAALAGGEGRDAI
jgi:hypothetical protein